MKEFINLKLLYLLHNCSCFKIISKSKNKVYPITLDIKDEYIEDNYEILLKDLNFENIVNPRTQTISEYKRVVPKSKQKNKRNNPFGYPSKIPITIITD